MTGQPTDEVNKQLGSQGLFVLLKNPFGIDELEVVLDAVMNSPIE